jgi:hypothetical protein
VSVSPDAQCLIPGDAKDLRTGFAARLEDPDARGAATGVGPDDRFAGRGKVAFRPTVFADAVHDGSVRAGQFPVMHAFHRSLPGGDAGYDRAIDEREPQAGGAGDS